VLAVLHQPFQAQAIPTASRRAASAAGAVADTEPITDNNLKGLL